jgi:hypothetical protein
MGRKSAAKGQHPPSPPPQRRAEKRSNPLLLSAIVAAAVGLGVLAFWRGSGSTAPAATAAQTDATGETQQAVQADSKVLAKTEATAKLGPHKQANLPRVPFQNYAPPRPPEVITAAYQFAAEHPEVLSYIPCFCGCERSGHTGNHDCFVRQRAENGDVIAWDEHGVECTVCIDVANRSRQMHASGASVRDIRAAIDKEFGPLSTVETPTPHPPAHNNH